MGEIGSKDNYKFKWKKKVPRKEKESIIYDIKII